MIFNRRSCSPTTSDTSDSLERYRRVSLLALLVSGVLFGATLWSSNKMSIYDRMKNDNAVPDPIVQKYLQQPRIAEGEIARQTHADDEDRSTPQG